MLFTKNLKNARFKKKLFYKFTKFFNIKDVVELQIYRLRLSDQWKVHFVFHVFLLKLYYTNANIVVSSKMILVNKDEKYEIKNILKNKKKWKKFYYFVRWKEFFFCENNWIFKHYLTNAQNMFKQYHKRELFITMMFKAKKSKFQIQKKNLLKEEWDADNELTTRRKNVERTIAMRYKLQYNNKKWLWFSFNLIENCVLYIVHLTSSSLHFACSISNYLIKEIINFKSSLKSLQFSFCLISLFL